MIKKSDNSTDDMKNMTVISSNNMNFLKRENLTAQEMVAFLKDGAKFRNFSDILTKIYTGDDLAEHLTNKLSIITGNEKSLVKKNVRNWLSGKNFPKNREDIFQICFALQLDEYASSEILGNLEGTGIHYRNPKELVYAYCLRTGKRYQEACALREKIAIQFEISKKTKEKSDNKNIVFTKVIRDNFKNVMNEEELFQFFQLHSAELGVIHETAYQKFMELLDLLQRPEDHNREEGSALTSIEKIVQDYLTLGIPRTKRTGSFSLLQKLVKKFWPSETDLMKMKNRKEDVSRKALILLYLITESFDDNYMDEADDDMFEEYDYYIEDEEDDEDTIWEYRIQKMNLFLEMYGMNLLDPGSPFDLLVIYSMRINPWSDKMEEELKNRMNTEGRTKITEDEMKMLMEDDASKRMESVIKLLYDDFS